MVHCTPRPPFPAKSGRGRSPSAPHRAAQRKEERLLAGKGAWRVHGGGFAGTTLNFVPLDQVETFVAAMNRTFGDQACTVLNIRPAGAAMIGD